MVSENDASYLVNLSLHVFILFTFLTIFFFSYVSNLTKQNIDNVFGDIINEEVDQLMNGLDFWDKRINNDSYPNIDYKQLDILATQIINNAKAGDPEISSHNKNLLYIGIGIVISLFIIIICFILYFSLVKKYDIHIGKILIENGIMFALIGGIEVYFFLKIASKYIPVTPDYVGKTILERIKYHMTQKS